MTPDKVRWGVLGAANIALKKVIPGMQAGKWCEIAAIASRDLGKAAAAAHKLGIPRAYGSYEELLADPEVEAVYNPLPNQFHVPWSIKAAEAGKHVLCEKPLSLTVAEAKALLAARNPYRGEDRRGVHGAHSSPVAASAGADQFGSNRPAPLDCGLFQLFQS
jgi:predicted dehydrogenase